jgi:hypothetical protein
MLANKCIEYYPEGNSFCLEKNKNSNVEDINALRAKFSI